MNTIIINLLAGPCSGKSTYCAGIFAKLKWHEINCEMALEYAKDLVWSENFKKLENQLYVFAKQQDRIYQLNGKVDVVITDSPLLLSIIYDAKNDELLKQLIVREHNKYTNINFFLKRKKKYSEKGRVQTFEEAIKIDEQIKDLLKENNIEYEEIDASPENIDAIVEKIISIVKANKERVADNIKEKYAVVFAKQVIQQLKEHKKYLKYEFSDNFHYILVTNKWLYDSLSFIEKMWDIQAKALHENIINFGFALATKKERKIFGK